MSEAELNALLSDAGCPTVGAGHKGVPTPAVLAQRAYKTLALPPPSGHRSPSETQTYAGYPFTYVNLWTYFWTDAATWTSRSVTVHVGPAWAKVTATPVQLTFDPGDGNQSVACPGPGRPWLAADQDNPPTAGACGYQYREPTPNGQPLTSTQTMVWQVIWTGSDNTSGTLATLSTATIGRLQILQIQSVNVPNPSDAPS